MDSRNGTGVIENRTKSIGWKQFLVMEVNLSIQISKS